jgi:hypothetical protein
MHFKFISSIFIILNVFANCESYSTAPRVCRSDTSRCFNDDVQYMTHVDTPEKHQRTFNLRRKLESKPSNVMCFNIDSSDRLFSYLGNVYDITGYKHPAGQSDLKKLVGKDASEFFNLKKYKFHITNKRVKSDLQKMIVGPLCPEFTTATTPKMPDTTTPYYNETSTYGSYQNYTTTTSNDQFQTTSIDIEDDENTSTDNSFKLSSLQIILISVAILITPCIMLIILRLFLLIRKACSKQVVRDVNG